jgi:uncharacterized protein (DUF433 family)
MNIHAPVELDLSKYITTSIYGDRPHIRGRRIPVATIAYSAQSQAWSISELAYQFHLSENEVLAALLYFAEHQNAIDRQEADYQQELDLISSDNGDHD